MKLFEHNEFLHQLNKKLSSLHATYQACDQVNKEAIEELEVLFFKETFTKGYRILHQDKNNDSLYFIFSGE